MSALMLALLNSVLELLIVLQLTLVSVHVRHADSSGHRPSNTMPMTATPSSSGSFFTSAPPALKNRNTYFQGSPTAACGLRHQGFAADDVTYDVQAS